MAQTAEETKAEATPKKSSGWEIPPPDQWGANSGIAGREAEMGKYMAMVLKTMGMTLPYPHETNDALVKQHLQKIQFAKDYGMLDKLIEHDIKTLDVVNCRVKNLIEKTGDKEYAMVALTERTGCHYQLVLETHCEPGKRTWTSPWGRVLKAAVGIGQFDLTEEEIHEQYVKPRLEGYARSMGVEVKISDLGEDKQITMELVD